MDINKETIDNILKIWGAQAADALNRKDTVKYERLKQAMAHLEVLHDKIVIDKQTKVVYNQYGVPVHNYFNKGKKSLKERLTNYLAKKIDLEI